MNKDIVAKKLACVGYETMFDNKWEDLPSQSIERALWITIASAMLYKLQSLWEEAKTKRLASYPKGTNGGSLGTIE